MVISCTDRKYPRYLEETRPIFTSLWVIWMSLGCINTTGIPWPLARFNSASLSLTMSMKKEEESTTCPEILSLGNSPQGMLADIRGEEDKKFTMKGLRGHPVNSVTCLGITPREVPRHSSQMMQREVHTTTTTRWISPKQLDLDLIKL